MARRTNFSALDPEHRVEAERYVRDQKSADLYKHLSQYLFWGATTVIAGLVGAVGFGHLALAALPWWAITGGVLALGSFLGSIFLSHKGTEIAERSNVLYSEIDSRNQARQMVQEISRAQASGEIDGNPMTRRDGQSWTASVGGRANNNGTWSDRVSAENASTERTR